MSDAPKRTVLIADSSADNRRPLRLALIQAGFGVVEAGSGAEAADALARSSFDVVLTDVWMPDTDGIALIRSIRQTSPRAIILVVTGGGPDMSIASAAALAQVWGARRTYVRPFDMNELILDIGTMFQLQ